MATRSSRHAALAVRQVAARATSTDSGSKPTIAGSFWAFIGVVVGAGVVVLLIGVLIFFMLRWNRRRRLSRRAGRGDRLSTSHPAPFAAGQRGFTVLHDADEADAFVATSPRASLDYGGGVGGGGGAFGGAGAYGRGGAYHPEDDAAAAGYGRYGYDDAYPPTGAPLGPATTPATGVAFNGYGRYAGYDDAATPYGGVAPPLQQQLPPGPGAHAAYGPPRQAYGHAQQASTASAQSVGDSLPHMPSAQTHMHS